MGTTKSAARQAAFVAALREAGGRRISVSLSKQTAAKLDRLTKRNGGTQNEAISLCIDGAHQALKARK
jgi:hypothetical protein